MLTLKINNAEKAVDAPANMPLMWVLRRYSRHDGYEIRLRHRAMRRLHGSLPIRLLPTPPTCRMLPGSGVKLCVGRCGDVARDAEQGTEGVERIEPPVEAEGEFVKVGLQVLVTDPVMDAVQPRFQVCEDEMDDWQILLGDLRIAPFSDGEVFVAALGKGWRSRSSRR